MSDTVTQLRGEADLIRGTALWKRYAREIDGAIEWYSRELRSNPKIGQTITYGASWQEQLSRLNKIANMFDSIIDAASKVAEDKSGPIA